MNTAEAHRLGKLLEHPVSTRVRRAHTNDWDTSDSRYNPVSVSGKAVAKGNLFGRSRTIAEASAEALYKNGAIRIRLYVQINGNVLVNINCGTSYCSFPLHSSRYRILSFRYSVWIYATTIHFSVGLNAYLDCNLRGQLSINVASRSVDGSISLTPRVRVVPEGGASLTFLV